jgi:hypothetical protein
MKKNIISYQYTRQNTLATTSQRVIEKMENNPVFPNPPAALDNLKKVLPEFQAALVKAKGRDKELVSIKNDKKAILLALLAELAEYVTSTCNGDRTLILSSGLMLQRKGTAGQALLSKHWRLNWANLVRLPLVSKTSRVPKPIYTSTAPNRLARIQYGLVKAAPNVIIRSRD